MHEVTLNRVQREALRRELEVWAGVADDFQMCVEQGDADVGRRAVEMTRDVAELMDAVGWSEQNDAPDAQTVRLSTRGLAPAQKGARELHDAMIHEIFPNDSLLEQYGALCALASGGDA